MARPLFVACVVALALAAGPAVAGDPAADLKSAEVGVRLAAVETLRTGAAPDAEALLVAALADTDWEVIEKAAEALGEKGLAGGAAPRGASPTKALLKVAMEHPAHRVRMTAARAIAMRGDWDTVADDFGKLKADDLARGLEPLAAVADKRESDALVKVVEKGLAARKDPTAREAAARGLGAYPIGERPARLRELSADPDVAVQAAAVEAIRAKPDEACLPVFVEILARPAVPETVARRVRAALVESIGRRDKGDAAVKAVAPVTAALAAATAPDAAWQYARLLGEIAELPDGHVPAQPLVDGLVPALTQAAAKVRSCGAWALGRVGGDPGCNRATELAKADTDAHVRFVALQSVARNRTAANEPAFRLFCDRLQYDPSPLVREEAAVQLGLRGVEGAAVPLKNSAEAAMAAKGDDEWPVAVAALVSLGKTRSPTGVDFLVQTSQKAKDWKFRAAAMVGLGHVRDVRAIPVLIQALDAKEPTARTVAFEFLRRAAPDAKLGPKQADWEAWWKKAGPGFVFVDREEENRKAQKYGYAPDPTGVYEGLDVVVFQSRGDKIEVLLSELKVDHRLTRSGQVPEAGLHPLALFVSNCTGEITPKDEEPIEWFLHAGGYMFSSCWSLNKTIERVTPGIIRKYPTKQEVLAHPVAELCRPGSPFVDGVFRPLVEPVYVLWGSHLVEVLDPDRAEVLMDSPWTEARFGCGNLVAWYTVGHGLVLDSANHFERQGFNHAENVSSSEERMAYALDHLGLTYPEFRKVPPTAWKTPQDADKDAKDLSSFRFITNFVRQKRKSQE